MMHNFINILQSLLNRKGTFCTLCFGSIDDEDNSLNATDQVIFKSETEKSIEEILNFILKPGISSNFISNHICLQCAETALSSYLFIVMVNNNNEYLSKTVKYITNTLESTSEDDLECVKAMYLFNGNSEFQSCYETKCNINSVQAAKLKKLTTLSEEKNEENIISIELEPKSVKDTKKSKHNTLTDMCENGGKRNVKCKLCLKVFPTITNFRSHYNRLHTPKTIKCPKCPKLFGSTTILKQHTKESHFNAICAECGKTFNNSHYLKIHELSHRVRFTCDTCKHVYKTKETFSKHLSFNICHQKQRKSWMEAQFKCDICSKRFCHKTSLRTHMFVHGNSQGYVCAWCNKRFSSQSHLNIHIMRHTKVKNFSCTICNGQFRTREGLIIHTRLHTGEKPYQCFDCDATFISTTLRSTHMQRCHREFQFECDMCCNKFKSKTSLDNHKIKLKCSNNSQTTNSSNMSISFDSPSV